MRPNAPAADAATHTAFRDRLGPTRRAWLGGLAGLAALPLAGCASAPPPRSVARDDVDDVQRQLEALVAHEMRAQNLAGLSLALVDDQRLLWARGWGWADRDAGRAAHADTRYRVGSVSKLYTASLAMQAVAQGRWTLEMPLAALLPALALATRWPDTPSTLRQVLTHHAGLPRDRLGGMWSLQAPDDFRALPTLLADQALVVRPGRSYAYSNLGYTLLGIALERLYGEPFEHLAQRQLLDPLGLPGSRYSAVVPEDASMARAHSRGRPRQEPGLRDVPAGGLNASVVELARFVSMQFAGGRAADGSVVLDERWQREMLRVQNADAPLDAGFQVGLGWHLTSFGEDSVHGGGPVAHHAGATVHHRTQLMLLPDHRLGVVVASNDAAAGAAVSRIAQRALALLLQAKAGIAPTPPRPGFERLADGDMPWPASRREACRGEYLTPAGVLAIDASDDRLSGQLGDRRFQLPEGRDDRFGLRYRWGGWLPWPLGMLERIGFECRRIEDQATLVAHLDGVEMTLGARLPPPALPPGAQALVGRYRPVCAPGELPTVEAVSLLVERGRLWAHVALNEVWASGEGVTMPLLPDGEGRLRIPELLAEGGEPVTWWREADGRPRLRCSGWTFEPAPGRSLSG